MATNGILRSLRTAVWQSLGTNVLDTAKAAAYSGMLMLFPAFLVLTTLLAVVPAGNNLLGDLRYASEQILPTDTMSLLQSYFEERKGFSIQVLLSATILTFFAAWGVMATLMAGFRSAYRLPRRGSRRSSLGRNWGPWERRLRALLLVPIALVPLSLASAIIIFGRPIEFWMVDNAGHDLLPIVLFLWRMGRWALALITSVTVLGTVYHFGTNSREHWRCVLPGAITATLLWFPTTLAFGLYVTRMANYSIIYGSLGAAIATLVWLYLSAYAVLLGAQLNGTLYRERMKGLIMHRATPAPLSPAAPPAVEKADAAATPQDMLVLDSPEMPREVSKS
ncbi:MAG TPA: YihY/virulence factor BrkB family protein [Acidobacteriaceae bacterium]|nr:YihY/virulence factor BrkB family protein [Acidobacteriaceae bacterium]